MNTKAKDFFDNVLNFFFPKKLKCIFCGKDVPNFDEKPYCEECENLDIFNIGHKCKCCDLKFPGEGEYCDFCKKNQKTFDSSHVPFIYEGGVRNAILRLKSSNAKYLVEPMGKLMANRLLEDKVDFDLIIPVPSSAKTMNKRKYNQAELLATEIGKITNKPVRTDILLKTKETQHQKELGFDDRQKNLAGAFSIYNWRDIENKKILLVDDILTTCATANRCSKLLKKHCLAVHVTCFARNMYKNKK